MLIAYIDTQIDTCIHTTQIHVYPYKTMFQFSETIIHDLLQIVVYSLSPPTWVDAVRGEEGTFKWYNRLLGYEEMSQHKYVKVHHDPHSYWVVQVTRRYFISWEYATDHTPAMNHYIQKSYLNGGPHPKPAEYSNWAEIMAMECAHLLSQL